MGLINNYKRGKVTTADVRTINNTVIILMILVAIASIVWSVSLHIISGDFNHSIFGAKIIFSERDFERLSVRAKELLHRDLAELDDEIYNADSIIGTSVNKPIESGLSINTAEEPTQKPKIRKISHLFQTTHSNRLLPDKPVLLNREEHNREAIDSVNDSRTLAAPEYNIAKDKAFLASMTVVRTPWQQSLSVQFIYSFPFISELVAVIWTAMCLIYQAGLKKYWGLPKPWRIVIPSIFVFTLMSIGSLAYMVIANGFLRHFCRELRAELTNPNALSCGQAMNVLRPLLVRHDLDTERYFDLFRISYVLSFVIWVLALLVMVLRYVFAIDFQLVDVQTIFERRSCTVLARECAEELLCEQSLRQQQQLEAPKLLLHGDTSHKSEDDYQSAKSHMSEIATTPLLDEQMQPKIA